MILQRSSPVRKERGRDGIGTYQNGDNGVYVAFADERAFRFRFARAAEQLPTIYVHEKRPEPTKEVYFDSWLNERGSRHREQALRIRGQGFLPRDDEHEPRDAFGQRVWQSFASFPVTIDVRRNETRTIGDLGEKVDEVLLHNNGRTLSFAFPAGSYLGHAEGSWTEIRSLRYLEELPVRTAMGVLHLPGVGGRVFSPHGSRSYEFTLGKGPRALHVPNAGRPYFLDQ